MTKSRHFSPIGKDVFYILFLIFIGIVSNGYFAKNDVQTNVKKQMKNYLKQKYAQEFEIEKLIAGRIPGGTYFQAWGIAKFDPQIRFWVNGGPIKNYKSGQKISTFSDRLPSIMASERRVNYINDVKDFTEYCKKNNYGFRDNFDFIRLKDEKINLLNLEEISLGILLEKLVNKKNYPWKKPDVFVFFEIFTKDSIDKSKEAKQLAAFFNTHLLNRKTGKSILLVSYFQEKHEKEFYMFRQNMQWEKDVIASLSLFKKKGFLKNACLIWNVKNDGRKLTEKEAIDSFLF